MKRILVLLIVIIVCASSALGLAKSPEGTWHKKLGELDFYAIQDAATEMDNAAFDHPEETAKLVPGGKSPASYNAWVVKKGDRTIVIDTGRGGQFLERLKSLGIDPGKVEAVLLTHTHRDHVGGLLDKDGNANFPNAEIWLAPKEIEFWKKYNKEMYENCSKTYGEFKTLNPDEKTAHIFPEILALNLIGHTPGHAGFLISSGAEKIIIVADLLHSGAIQFTLPEAAFRADDDKEIAVKTRRKWMKRAADDDLVFAAAHLPFPGIGKVKNDGNAFRFIPVQNSNNDMAAKGFYDFTVKDIDGKDFSLSQLKGKKVMVVNVASKCGLTPQYKELQELQAKYGGEKFTVIAFPANDFLAQEPGTDAEIKEFCTTNYDVSFPVMSKISVAGDKMHLLYKWLCEKELNGVNDARIQWNFQKFLIDENGNLVESILPREKPNAEKIIRWIEE